VPRGLWAIVGYALIGLLVLGGLSAVSERLWPQAAGPCQLHASAAVVGRDSPLGRTAGWDTDVLAIRSRDRADWVEVELTLFGFETSGNKGKQLTRRYKRTKDVIEAGSLAAFNLTEFE
jgi:hypothetical protein